MFANHRAMKRFDLAALQGGLMSLAHRAVKRALRAETHVHRDVLGRKTPYLKMGRPERGTLVFLHGFSDRPENFLATAAFLAKRYEIIAPAMPGFHDGFVDPDETHSTEAYSAWLSEIVKEIAPRRFHLMGNSLGGATALGVAHRLADRVATLTLVNPAVIVPGVTSVLMMPHGIRTPFVIRERAHVDQFIESVVAHPTPFKLLTGDFFFADMGSHADWYEKVGEQYGDSHKASAARGHVASVDPAEIRTPTLIVWGDRDGLFPVQTAHRLEELLATSELAMLRGIGHLPHLESPHVLARAFEEFAQRRGSEIRDSASSAPP